MVWLDGARPPPKIVLVLGQSHDSMNTVPPNFVGSSLLFTICKLVCLTWANIYILVLMVPPLAFTCSLYYKHITIVNYDFSIVNKFGASLTVDARVIIYDCPVFIVQATWQMS